MATDAAELGEVAPAGTMWAWAFKSIAAINRRSWASHRQGVQEGWGNILVLKDAECAAGTFASALWMGREIIRLACMYEVVDLEEVPDEVSQECCVSAADIIVAEPQEEGDETDPRPDRGDGKAGKRSLESTQAPEKQKKKLKVTKGKGSGSTPGADRPGTGDGDPPETAAVPARGVSARGSDGPKSGTGATLAAGPATGRGSGGHGGAASGDPARHPGLPKPVGSPASAFLSQWTAEAPEGVFSASNRPDRPPPIHCVYMLIMRVAV